MIGYRIKIKSSKLDTFWYAGKIGEIFWADMRHLDNIFHIINEGVDSGRRLSISIEDVEILGKAEIEVEQITSVRLIESIEL